MNHIRVAPLLLAFSISGCLFSHSTPPNNAAFEPAGSVKTLEGIYQNRGEAQKHVEAWLSMIIWPGTEVDHHAIDRIEVKAVSDRVLVVKGLHGESVVKESSFEEGKDFAMTNGRIVLKHGFGIAGSTPGEVVFGPYYEKTELGLDEKGAGKYKDTFGVIGLVALLFPIAAGGTEEVRFVRLGNP